MCGIAGICVPASFDLAQLELDAARMGSSIAHRGGDSSGLWSSYPLGVALTHQRLSIQDLSPAGHQPMISSSGRYTIAFNGEIYNHQELRLELRDISINVPWRGTSDTETLLEGIETWGLERTLHRCVGMWAFALLDRQERVIHLAVDRFGEKPLYWGLAAGSTRPILIFASELAALRSHPFFTNNINLTALSAMLQTGHVPAPLSIYSGIAKLQPGHIVSIPLPLQSGSSAPTSRSWWDLNDLITHSCLSPFNSVNEALDCLEKTLVQSVVNQSLADVPLGTFLSGGVDSSLVTALLQSHTRTPLRTFTVGFEESSFDEAPYARDVASYLGTHHSETILTSSDALSLVPGLASIYSEPFADSSQLPTTLVCREAKRSGLTVALSGDGGDELFGGYNRYLWSPLISKRLAWLPHPLLIRLATAIRCIPMQTWDLLSLPTQVPHLGLKVHKVLSRIQSLDNVDEFYASLLSDGLDSSILSQYDPQAITNKLLPSLSTLPECLLGDSSSRMMAWDTTGYLPNDILVKIDRAAMSVGLETRAPFLDHRVAAAAWRLPPSMKIRGTTTKWALRQILYKYVPRELIDRPKAGFAIPIGQWLRGPLRLWADDLLHPDRLALEGYLRPEPIRHIWHQHLSCSHDHSNKLWNVLMWQAWLQQWG